MFINADGYYDEKLASVVHFNKNEEGNFDIFIEQKNLKDPKFFVPTESPNITSFIE